MTGGDRRTAGCRHCGGHTGSGRGLPAWVHFTCAVCLRSFIPCKLCSTRQMNVYMIHCSTSHLLGFLRTLLQQFIKKLHLESVCGNTLALQLCIHIVYSLNCQNWKEELGGYSPCEVFFFLRFYLFLERGREGEKEGGNIDV